MKVADWFIALFLICSVSACGATRAYDGPSRSREEVATLKAFGSNFVTVNGRPIGMHSTSVQVLPGKNEVVVKPSASNYNSPGAHNRLLSITVDAAPGEEYHLLGQRGEGHVCAWLVNKRTGSTEYKVHAGCAGGDVISPHGFE